MAARHTASRPLAGLALAGLQGRAQQRGSGAAAPARLSQRSEPGSAPRRHTPFSARSCARARSRERPLPNAAPAARHGLLALPGAGGRALSRPRAPRRPRGEFSWRRAARPERPPRARPPRTRASSRASACRPSTAVRRLCERSRCRRPPSGCRPLRCAIWFPPASSVRTPVNACGRRARVGSRAPLRGGGARRLRAMCPRGAPGAHIEVLQAINAPVLQVQDGDTRRARIIPAGRNESASVRHERRSRHRNGTACKQCKRARLQRFAQLPQSLGGELERRHPSA